MADIVVRKNSGDKLLPAFARELEPMRAIRSLLRWDPFQEMAPAWPSEGLPTTFLPAFEVKETKDAYLFKADVPGVKETDVEVTMTGNRLNVSGKREEEREEAAETYYTCERTYGSFSRSFTLPDGADTEHVHADLKGGVLTLAVPKKPEVQPKRIAVNKAKV